MAVYGGIACNSLRLDTLASSTSCSTGAFIKARKTIGFVSFSRRRRGKITVTGAITSSAPGSSSTVKEDEQQFLQQSLGESQDKEDKKFSWTEHWYPVSLVEDLDPKAATPFKLLGREIVVWKDGEGNWRAFSDQCPHRLAPLSEGRIDENGWLQCSYHGWSFKGDGSCGKIPQAATQGPESKAVASPRACAISFPAVVSQGLLFVWPDEKGWESAQRTQPPQLPAVFDDPSFSTVTIQRDLFYGYDTLMENVSDPSHIDFAHHKVTGKRDRAKPLTFKVDSRGPWGFSGANSDTPKITAEFLAPCYYINKIEIPVTLPLQGPKTWEIWICSFNVPMAPGQTRSIVCSARNFFTFLMPGPAWWQASSASFLYLSLVPRWHEHWTSNKVYDGDMIVLQGQEKKFLATGGDINAKYSQITFTPTQADRFVLEFRNWLRKHGNGEPKWAAGTSKTQPLPSTVLSKQQMLDRYQQHTLNCSSCRNAFKAFKVAGRVLIGATVVFAVATGIPQEIILKLIFAGLAMASAGTAFLLKELEENFVYKDYVHAEID
ncbi:hypothetical protein SELMODRAFT_174928 [Selaginella moellendorffii]|uniref:Rieske domain-containing protein n=1 Tax=Selaginella moellendorffii TaxID=88036 RepID=D8RWL0_SELML|nr:hypothetical protein SELMODRAFT_174928 [Selaginella moellendorffii]